MPEIIAEPPQRAPDYLRNPDKGGNGRPNQWRVPSVERLARRGRVPVRKKTAARLMRRAARRRPDGGRGLLARRAWRRLMDRGDHGDANAAEAVWQAFVSGPDNELWRALSRWWDPRDLTDAVVRAGTDPGRDAAARAAIGAFYDRGGLAPGDAVQRALFYTLTGHTAQYRAADPDGSLLAAAYRGANEPTRTAVRQALAGSRDLDVVEVVAGSGSASRAADLTLGERSYLARQVADRKDWGRLWDLLRDLPLDEALAATALFEDGWRPGPHRERELFARLERWSGPHALADARDALAEGDAVSTAIYGEPVAGSFSPDGGRLAVATRAAILVFEIPGMRLADLYELEEFWPTCLLDTGHAVLACDWDGPLGRGERPPALVLCERGRMQALRPRTGAVRVTPHPAGFLVLDGALGANQWHREGAYRLRLCEVGGREIRDVPLAELGYRRTARGPWAVAVDPVSGKIALGSNGLRILDRRAGRVLAACEVPGSGRITGVCWVGSGWLAATVAHSTRPPRTVDVFRLTRAGLRHAGSGGEALMPLPAGSRRTGSLPIPVPERDEIALIKDDGEVAYADVRTLTEIDEPRDLTGRHGSMLWSSPGKRYQALGGPGSVEVVSGGLCAVRELAGRPMAGMRPTDLATVSAVLRDALPGSPVRPLLELFQAFLEHRFGADVGDHRSTLAAATDDIGIRR